MKKSVVKPLAKAEPFKIRGKKWLRLPRLVTLFAIALTLTLIGVIRLPVLATVPNGSQPVAASTATSPSDPFQLYEQGKFEDARKLWEKAADAAVQTGDRITELRNRINQAQALKSLGAYLRAEQVLKTALAQIDSIQPDQQSGKPVLLELKATLLRSLGDVYQAKGDLDNAHLILNQSLEIATKLNLRDAISAAYFSLGMTERSEIIRNIPGLLTITLTTAEQDIAEQIKVVLDVLQDDPSLTPPTIASQPKKVRLAKVFNAFQQTTQFTRDSAILIQAELNQFSLLVNLLPQLDRYLTTVLIATGKKLTDNNADYFLTHYLNDQSLEKDLSPLLPAFPVSRRGSDIPEQVEPGLEIRELAQLQSRIATLTDFTIQGLSQISDRIAQLPDTSETVESRIHYAQTLLRLKQVADESDRVDIQLRSHLKAILGKVQEIYAAPAYQQQLPPRSTIDPVFRKVTREFQTPQRSLFLTQNTRSLLQSQVKGSLQQATQILTPAIATAHTLKNDRIEAAAGVLLADVYGLSADLNHTSSQWAAVETLSQRAMQLIQAEDAPDLVLRVQQQYARSLIKQSKTSAAQAACRVAATTLQANRSNLIAIDQDVQYSFLESVDPFYRECVTTLLPTGSEVRIQDNLKDARNLIEALQLAELDNFFRESCIEGRKTGIDTLVEDQKNLNTAVIYPILLSKRQVGVIAKLPNVKELQYYASESLNQDIEKVLFQLSTQITDINKSSNSQTQALSKTVYDWLIAPLRHQLKSIDTLVFVPDAAFRNVPMAALYDGQRYLIDDFAIALSPGLQLTNPQTNDQPILRAIGAGLIDIPDKYKLGKFPKELVDQEFNSMKKAGILSQEPLLEDAFTSLELANQLEKSSFNVVHLSTHARFSSQKDKTYILMANGRVNVDEFSAVLRKRIQQKGAIELLVLSACQTASGDNRAALGLAGIAIKSGARSTLATLWTVNAQPTADFLESFYQEYVNSATRTAKQTKAKALQAAQIQLKQKTNDPRIWAAYVMVGNWL